MNKAKRLFPEKPDFVIGKRLHDACYKRETRTRKRKLSDSASTDKTETKAAPQAGNAKHQRCAHKSEEREAPNRIAAEQTNIVAASKEKQNKPHPKGAEIDDLACKLNASRSFSGAMVDQSWKLQPTSQPHAPRSTDAVISFCLFRRKATAFNHSLDAVGLTGCTGATLKISPWPTGVSWSTSIPASTSPRNHTQIWRRCCPRSPVFTSVDDV